MALIRTSDPIFFAGSTYADAEYVVFGVPYDTTATFGKGTRYGPKGIRELGCMTNFEHYMFDYRISLLDIPTYDAGDLDVSHLSPDEMVREVHAYSKKLVADGKFPVMLGGEHSVSPGLATAFDDIAVLGIDAHADFRNEYQGERNNHGCAMRRIVDKFGEDRVMWVGVRSFAQEEHESSAKFLDSFTIFEKGIDWTISEIRKRLPYDRIYLTLDIDGIDPAFAPGTGTPEPYGLEPVHVKKIIDALAPQLVGFDVVEVAPPLESRITPVLAARFVTDVVASTYVSKKSMR